MAFILRGVVVAANDHQGGRRCVRGYAGVDWRRPRRADRRLLLANEVSVICFESIIVQVG